MMTDTPKLTRRKFLKLAGAAGTLAIPTLLGYDLLRDAEGEFPPSVSPYAPVDVLESWSSLPAVASPILLLTNERGDNPFGAHLTEILRAEGLNCFLVARVSAVDSAILDRFDLVLLAEGPLDNAQVELLEGYVARGGRLVAMRPDVRLAALFGLGRMAGSTTEGYLQVEAGHPIAEGIATETLQFHGVADHYRLAGAQVVAWLASDADTRTDFPAVTLHRYGQGQAALWAFDLARSVAYTRQGNPAWANQERDGVNFVRACDMFKGWVDLDRLAIPQADEQQRLLANLLTAMSQEARPLPRLWYFPGAARSMLIATGDAHQAPAQRVEDVLRLVEQWGGHMSIYYAPPLSSHWYRAARNAKRWAERLPLVGGALFNPYGLPGPSHVADWRARGHEFALHPYVGQSGVCAGYTSRGTFATPSLDAAWRRYWEEFTGMSYGPVSATVRTHCILWKGWVETARTQAAFGMHMNLDYYHVGPTFQSEAGEWAYGHFTGSGLPMRFVDEQGRILNIYQQLTQLADEHLLQPTWKGSAPNLSTEEAIEVSRTLLGDSMDGAYSAIVAQFHADGCAADWELASSCARWLEGTLDYAAAQGIPIWSDLEWLHFTEVRHDANLDEILWHPAARRLEFRLAARAVPDVELAVMVPVRHGDARLAQMAVDGLVVGHREREVGGIGYGWVSVGAGSHQIEATYA